MLHPPTPKERTVVVVKEGRAEFIADEEREFVVQQDGFRLTGVIVEQEVRSVRVTR